MERKDVYALIDGERDYQDAMTADPARPDMIDDLHVGDTLSAMRVALRMAEDAWYSGSEPHPNAMEYMRKIAGLAVKCMEKNGAPARLMPKPPAPYEQPHSRLLSDRLSDPYLRNLRG